MLSLNRRHLIIIVIASIAAALSLLYNPHAGEERIDFVWAYAAAQDLIAGRDVYNHPFNLNLIPYPLTSALIAMPFALFPAWLAVALFSACSAGILAWGLTRRAQMWPLLLFLSSPYLMAVKSIQWTPLLTAVLLIPALLPLTLAKPHIGLAIGLWTRWRFWTVGLTLLLLALSFLIYPSWVLQWRSQIGPYHGFVPILTGPGPLIILALWPAIRKRDRCAALVVTLACIPQQYYLYDALPLLVIARNRQQMLALVCASWLAYFLAIQWTFLYGGLLATIFCYLPAVGVCLLNMRSQEASQLG